MCFGLFKKKKKSATNPEVVIPIHQQERDTVEKRKDKITKLKKEHKKLKKEELVAKVINDSIKDQKLVDIDFSKNDVSLFQVNGVYSVGPVKIVNGFLESGKLKKGMKTKHNGIEIKVQEVRKDRSQVPSLKPGHEGTLVIKSEKNPLLESGTFLEFE
jgi:hypothetical protein